MKSPARPSVFLFFEKAMEFCIKKNDMKKSISHFKLILILLVIASASEAFCQTAEDEKEVRLTIQKMEDSFNAHDYSFAGKYDLLTSDAFFINPVGMYWKNKSEIVKALAVLGEIRLKHESVKLNIKQIQFLAPTVAVVVAYGDGRVEDDYSFPDGSKGGSKGDATKGVYSYTLIKIHSTWKIKSMQITMVDSNAAAMNPIK